MFSGIVLRTAAVVRSSREPAGLRLTLAAHWPGAARGQSVAVNGCCLTIAGKGRGTLSFDVVPETLARTNLGLLKRGDRVNIERPLRMGDRLDGHFVQGHVDGLAHLVRRIAENNEVRLRLRCPAALAKYLTPKGSVTLDGVSLTIAAVRGRTFEVALIPVTLEKTTLADGGPGRPYNVEMDIITKTVAVLMQSSIANRKSAIAND